MRRGHPLAPDRKRPASLRTGWSTAVANDSWGTSGHARTLAPYPPPARRFPASPKITTAPGARLPGAVDDQLFGRMFWFIRNKLFGSYLALIFASRSKFGP